MSLSAESASTPELTLWPDFSETVQGAAEDLRAGRRTCVSLVEACLTQIDRWEPHVHAWVRVDREGALNRARELDREGQAGRWQGPLHGIPIGIKDLIDVAGWPTGAGSELLAQTIAERDAPLVSRLRNAGAIILGKTVTTQFACFDPPVTRNPWNLERTPGGSSSGSAVAVATGMCLAAIGSQTGGSITRPASFCGVAGCKPTFGRIPIEGIFPVAHSLDHPGPIARTVADLAMLTDLVGDCRQKDVDWKVLAPMARPPRVGIERGWDSGAEPAMTAAFDLAIDRLKGAGAEVAHVRLPEAFGRVHWAHWHIMRYEIGKVHLQRFEQHPDDYLPGMRRLIEESRAIDDSTYAAALNMQRQIKVDMPAVFDIADVLAWPATTGPAPAPSTTGDPSFNSPWSLAGLPTVSFPIGLAPDGMPLAIQLVGPADGESQLFAAAQWCESVLSRSW